MTGNSAIVFAAGTLAGISLGGNTTITADPPASVGALLAPSPNAAIPSTTLVLHPVTVFNVGDLASSTANMNAGHVGNAAYLVGGGAAPSNSVSNFAVTMPEAISVPTNSLNSLQTSISSWARTKDAFTNDLASQSAASSWLSETEMSNGQIPVSFSSDTAFGVQGDLEEVLGINQAESLRTHETVAARLSTSSGSKIQNVERGRRELNLAKGSVVFAPTIDSSITTPFGTVHVDALSEANSHLDRAGET